MPITGPSSYVPTMNAFMTHWASVNTALGAGGPLVVEGGATLATLTGYRDQLSGFAASIQGAINDVEIPAGNVVIQRGDLLGRLGEFNRKVRGFLSQTAYANALPDAPGSNSGEGIVLKALDDMSNLWSKINAATIPGFTGPLLLLNGYSRATFVTDLAALKSNYTDEGNATQSLKLERERRNQVQDLAYVVLRDYRKAVNGTFAPTDAFVASLPALSPAPGSTPTPVVATVVYNTGTGQADITWTESTDSQVTGFEVRFCASPNYSTETENVIGNVALSAPRQFHTASGLGTNGAQASFKVYSLTATGNESGSNAVSVTRVDPPPPPGGP